MCVFAWQFWLLLNGSGGLFSYVLDDAYIHLALSENLMQGHYGVNLNEYSAPSSSILWSFLLAPFATWQYWPLVLNFSLSLIALWLWNAQLAKLFNNKQLDQLRFSLNTLFFIIANLIGMSFTGMENVLQLVVSLGICYGVFQLIDQKNSSLLLLSCIIIAPLVRYETITLSCIGLFFLVYNRYYSKAMITLGLMLLPLIGFSFYLNSIGLGYMPSSISAKSSAMQSSALTATLINFYNNLYEPTGSLLMLLSVPLVWAGLIQYKQQPQKALLTIGIAGVVLAHLALGRLGNWGRYEIYAWMSLVSTYVYIFHSQLIRWYLKPTFPRALGYAALLLVCIICAKRYIVTSTMNHVGGANIALQQMQMHRFITDFWQQDVAVNDLGWVAYQNDHYVLDLWGLANTRALQLRKNQTPDMLKILTQEQNIKLAMIYEPWFEQEIPNDWQLIGSLHLPQGMRNMTSAEDSVQFFATQESAALSIRQYMIEFGKTLPAGAFIQIIGDE